MGKLKNNKNIQKTILREKEDMLSLFNPIYNDSHSMFDEFFRDSFPSNKRRNVRTMRPNISLNSNRNRNAINFDPFYEPFGSSNRQIQDLYPFDNYSPMNRQKHSDFFSFSDDFFGDSFFGPHFGFDLRRRPKTSKKSKKIASNYKPKMNKIDIIENEVENTLDNNNKENISPSFKDEIKNRNFYGKRFESSEIIRNGHKAKITKTTETKPDGKVETKVTKMTEDPNGSQINREYEIPENDKMALEDIKEIDHNELDEKIIVETSSTGNSDAKSC